MSAFKDQLRQLLNSHSRENGSNTPDFILANFMSDCLDAFDGATKERSRWYGRNDSPGQQLPCAPPCDIGPLGHDGPNGLPVTSHDEPR